jgi:hypothetical protein
MAGESAVSLRIEQLFDSFQQTESHRDTLVCRKAIALAETSILQFYIMVFTL